MGAAAIDALMEDQRNVMMGVKNDEIVYVPFSKAAMAQTCGRTTSPSTFVAEAEAAQVGLMLSTSDVYALREGLAISEEIFR